MKTWITVTKAVPGTLANRDWLREEARRLRASGFETRILRCLGMARKARCRRRGRACIHDCLLLCRSPGVTEKACRCQNCGCEWQATEPAAQAGCPRCGETQRISRSPRRK